MLGKLTYWLQQTGDKVMTVMIAMSIILMLLVTVAQMMLLVGMLPQGWMP